jgi:uncharacterized protein YecT (DUF1311 family)
MLNIAPAALLLLLAVASPVAAQLDIADEATKARCSQALKEPLPAEAAAAPAPQQFPECNSYKLYEGIGTAVDFTAARRCAWSERQATLAGLEPRYTNASVFGGSAMLTVLYANGEGVAKNIPLAMRFACEAEGAPAEIGGRLQDLQSRIDSPKASHGKFDFCDATTSGFMMGFCSGRNEEIHAHERDDRLARLAKAWPPQQQQLFAQLIKLEAEYAEAHGRGETDLSGTARAMEEIDAESSLKDDFVEAITAFEAGKLPHASAEEATKADTALNQAYQEGLKTAEGHKAEYGAVQPEGIHKAERAWIKYRDAWLAFAALRYPTATRETWIELLTEDRTLILTGKSCGVLENCEERWSPRPLP